MIGGTTAVPLEGGPIEIRGAVRIERTERGLLPRRVTEEGMRRIPDAFMRAAVGQSAGIRLAFRTAATRLELTVSGMKMTDSATAPLPAAAYELCSGGDVVAVATSSIGPRYLFSFEQPLEEIVAGPDDILVFDVPPGEERDFELWLPYSDEVELLGFSADGPVHAPRDREAAIPLRWLHHGSSISHGYHRDDDDAHLARDRYDRDALWRSLRANGYLWLRDHLSPEVVLAFRRFYFEALAGTGLVGGADPGAGRRRRKRRRSRRPPPSAVRRDHPQPRVPGALQSSRDPRLVRTGSSKTRCICTSASITASHPARARTASAPRRRRTTTSSISARAATGCSRCGYRSATAP